MDIDIVALSEPELIEIAPDAGAVELILVPLTLIDPNPFQPRKVFDQAKIERLALELRCERETLPETSGLMQVPIARKLASGRYELAFGHRRYEAFKYNYETMHDAFPWWQMPLRLANLTDEQMYALAARENSQRQALNDIEKAESIKLAMEVFGWNLSRASRVHGLAMSTGSNLVRLLDLPQEVQDLVARGRLPQRHAKELLRLVQAEPPLVKLCVKLARETVANKPTAEELGWKITQLLQKQQAQQNGHGKAIPRKIHPKKILELADELLCPGCRQSSLGIQCMGCLAPAELAQAIIEMAEFRAGQAEELFPEKLSPAGEGK